jgi:DNA-directed RNA polymerase specialized sigma24 family protein
MADPHRFPPARGDEAELFHDFNDRLMRAVARSAYCTTPHTLEDACAFAWTEFMRRQPDRANCHGWLVVVAKREAWRIERERFDSERHVPVPIDQIERADDAISPVEEVEIRHDVGEAFGVLAELRPRLQRVALLRALQFTKPEIAAITGDSVGRVDKLVSSASARIQQILAARLPQRQQPAPRAERLWSLENEPPDWLADRIGGPPRLSRKNGGTIEMRRAWRRAAIALDDFRQAIGIDGFESHGLARPLAPALQVVHAKALNAIDQYESLREPERGSTRER